jgi:pantoate--beta-alanine ligase
VRRCTTIAEVRAAVTTARASGARVGFVPTMGALHDGHLALVREAARRADHVVVSIFVNPTQFDRPDDLAAYPRDLAGDEHRLRGLGTAAPDVVFAPPATELYPDGPPLTRVHVAGLGDVLEGASRPGHFDGVATVVTKLLAVVAPDLAVFGRKDHQQLQVIRRLVLDLDLPVEIVDAPTVRDPDGVAMSSRNRRLDDDARVAARGLSRALRAAVEVARSARAAGADLDPDALRDAALAVLDDRPGLRLDRLDLVDPTRLTPAALGATSVSLLVAAFVGDVRLIDNVEVGDLDDEARLLAATDPARDPATDREDRHV